jgi:hypothetical protein
VERRLDLPWRRDGAHLVEVVVGHRRITRHFWIIQLSFIDQTNPIIGGGPTAGIPHGGG